MATDNELNIKILVDASQLQSGMSGAVAITDDAFNSLAAAQIRVSTASKELNSQLNTLAKSGLAPTTEQTEEVAAAMFEARTAADAFAAAETEVYGATERMTGGVNNARVAFTGLTQDLGLRGSRALGSFIAQSETLGPILQSAFSGIAVLAFVEIASKIPDVIKKASESLMGWNKEAKEAYQTQLKLNETIGEHRKELELDKIANTEAGLKGATKTAEEIANINKKIALLKSYQNEQGRIALQAERELEATKVIPAHMAGRVLVQQQEVRVIEDGSDAWNERKKRIQEATAKVEDYENQIQKLQQVETPRTNAMFNEQQADEAEKNAEKIQQLQERSARAHDRLEKQKEEATHKRIMAELNDEERIAKEQIKDAETEAAMDKEFNRNAEAEEKKLDANILAAKKNLFAQIVKEQEKYIKEVDRALKQEQKLWDDMFRQINRGFNSVIEGFLTGHATILQSFAKLGSDIVMTMIRALTKILVEHIAHSAAVRAIEASSIAQRLAQFAGGEASKKAIQSTSNVAQVTGDAGTGAAAAFASVIEALPFPANVAAAPGVAAAVLAQIESFATVASAAGGMLVPADGTLSMLHKNEMVLPASLSAGVQRMVSGGGSGGDGFGGGGDVHVHMGDITALDAKGVDAILRDRSDTLIAMIRQAQREFRI
jgi:hypothetical protein